MIHPVFDGAKRMLDKLLAFSRYVWMTVHSLTHRFNDIFMHPSIDTPIVSLTTRTLSSERTLPAAMSFVDPYLFVSFDGLKAKGKTLIRRTKVRITCGIKGKVFVRIQS